MCFVRNHGVYKNPQLIIEKKTIHMELIHFQSFGLYKFDKNIRRIDKWPWLRVNGNHIPYAYNVVAMAYLNRGRDELVCSSCSFNGSGSFISAVSSSHRVRKKEKGEKGLSAWGPK